MSRFADELRDRLAEITAALDVEINPDTSGFADALRTRLETIQAQLDVTVGVDQTSLDNLENLIRARLALMDLAVDIHVGADTRVAANDIAMLRQLAGQDMTIQVDADTASAAAQIAALNGQTVTVNVAASGTSRSGSGGLPSGFGNAGLLNAGVLGIGALPAGGAAIASIGADIQALAQAGALLPGIFAGAAAGVSTLVVGLGGMKDALFADGKKAMEAYDGLGREGRALVDTSKRFGDQWDRISTRVQNTTLAGLSQPLDRMLTTQLPALDRGMGGVAKQFNTGLHTALDELGNEQSTTFLDTVFANTTDAAGNLNGSITPIINSVRTLGGTGSTFLPQLAQGFTNATTRLDAFLTRADKSGDLSRWMREGIDTGRELFSVIGNVGSMIASVLRAGKTDGDGFLGTVDNLTERWAGWLKSSEGQAKMKSFFAEGREQLDRWLPLLKSAGSLIVTAYEAAQAWSAILMPFLRAGSELLGQHDSLLKTVLISYLAFRTLSPIFNTLQTAISGANTRLQTFRTAMASSSGTTAFSRALGGIGAMLGPGGLVTAGVVTASALIGTLAAKHQEAADAAERQRTKLRELRETLDEQIGAVTKESIASTTNDLEDRGFLERAQTLGVDPQRYVRAGLGLDQAGKDDINARLTGIILEQYPKDKNSKMQFDQVAQTLGLTSTEVAQALQGIPDAVAKFDQAWAKNGNGSLQDLAELKEALPDIAESAATLGGEMNGLETETGRARESHLRINEALNGTFQLTERGKAAFEAYGGAVGVVTANTVELKAASAEQAASMIQGLRAAGREVELMPDEKTLKITLNADQAKSEIREVTKPESKTVTINAEYAKATESGEWRAPMAFRADGGPVTGGIPGRDSVPILAMPGEHMLTTSDVDKLGGQAGVYRFRAALQAGLVRPMRAGGAVGWTRGDEVDLQQAQNAVTKAEEELRVLDFKKNVSPSQRRAAELKIDEAKNKVHELEDKKAGRTGSSTEVLPQQALPGRRSGKDLDREDAQAAVDQANTERNRVYNDLNSTPEEQAAADRKYQRAQNSLAEANKSEKSGDSTDLSLQGIFSRAGGIVAEGILSGLGLENSILSSNNVYNKAFNSIVDFSSNTSRDEQAGAGDGYAYVPKNLPVDREDRPAGTSGQAGRSAESYDAGGGVEQWSGTFAQVLRGLAMPASWLELGKAQMRTESGGNPKAINLWDSNAQKGTPSKGLMQVIDPTFASYRSALYPDDIWDPSANIAAALRYTVARYGSPVGVWGQGHGYRNGGWAWGPGGPRGDGFFAPLSNGEFVVNAVDAALNAPTLEAINAGLPVPLPPLPVGMGARGGDSTTINRDHGTHFHAPIQLADPHEFIRELERHQALQAQGPMAGLPG
ncbi:transglycosylase SLT domain-containing protein [Nocardia amamiensis]|uniref:Transglycosylase SLT domain-containing protein n=2 Tax=Nocardia amamiensis TaxID=404578 RepID=A0ABS0CX41_9NOCA|nr:transglycosylase SLT domain-containing protein [Nocardia amamiensis]